MTATRAADARTIEGDDRRVWLAVSSETPVGRFFGDEILVHERSSIDLEFFGGGRAPLLMDHDPRDQIGVIERVTLDDDRVLRALVRFSQADRAQSILNDIRDGIRANTSVGYDIDECEALPKGNGYRITKWVPLEVSIVSMPADSSVGVGRSTDEINHIEVRNMTTPVITDTSANEARIAEALAAREAEFNAREAAVNARAEAIADAYELAAHHNIARADVTGWLTAERRKLSADALTAQFRGFVLGKIEGTGRPLVDTGIGLSVEETRQFSLFRLLRAMGSEDRSEIKAAGFEFEACDAAAQMAIKAGARSHGGAHLPSEILLNWAMPAPTNGKRVLNTADDAAIVPTEFLAGSFIDLLRKKTAVMQAGATILSGLHGSLEIPKQTASGSATWITAEDGSATVTEPTFGMITMSPHDLAAYVDMSRRMMQQSSPAVEGLVRNDIIAFMRLAIDKAAIEGTGAAGQPTGVLNVVGINKPTKFAAAMPTWAEIIALESALADDEALDGNLAYILRTNMRGAFKSTLKAAGMPEFIMNGNGQELNGYTAHVSNQITDGNVYFGNWSDLLIGFWSGLEIAVDTSGALALKGAKRFITFQTLDVQVRHPESFAYNNDD